MKYAVVIVKSEHSEVFHEIAESVHYALLALGHDSIISEFGEFGNARWTWELQGAIPIILGWNILPPNAALPPNSILYNFEHAWSHWLREERLKRFKGLRFWDWNRDSMNELISYGHTVAHVPLGYVPEWTRVMPAKEKDIDVLFYGSMNMRRQSILTKLKRRLPNVLHLYGVYGAERDDYVARSKVVLNMHYTDGRQPAFEIARVGYLLANRALVLSEASSATEGFGNAIDFQPYYQLVRRACELVSDLTENERLRLAEDGFEAMKNRPMTEFLRGVVSPEARMSQHENNS